MRALWTAASGMISQTTNVDVITNNLANVNTTGFKDARAEFEDLMYQEVRPAGATSASGNMLPTGLEVGLGSRPVSTVRIFTEGPLQQTGNQLDLAIQGDGFFQVTLPDGSTAYTRAGDFSLDSAGEIVTPEGYLLQPSVVVPTNAVSISVGKDGSVSAKMQDGTVQDLGTIQLARFINPSGLTSLGSNLYQNTPASGDAILGTPGTQGIGWVEQGMLEMSNVQVVEEMVNLITAERAYESCAKGMTVCDQMLSDANNVKQLP